MTSIADTLTIMDTTVSPKHYHYTSYKPLNNKDWLWFVLYPSSFSFNVYNSKLFIWFQKFYDILKTHQKLFETVFSLKY